MSADGVAAGPHAAAAGAGSGKDLRLDQMRPLPHVAVDAILTLVAQDFMRVNGDRVVVHFGKGLFEGGDRGNRRS